MTKQPVFRTLLIVGLIASAPATLPRAHAWGTRAHKAIDRAAIMALPDDGPVFLKRYADLIAWNSVMPDTWRDGSEPFSRIAEDPNHGWFMEQFAFLHPVPRSRQAFIIALEKQRANLPKSDIVDRDRLNIRWTGTLPYAAVEGYEREVTCMRALRALPPGSPDAPLQENRCAFIAAWFSHYIADGSQPLHVTIHHDGWVGPNPDGFTREHAVHGRFETQYVNAIALTPADIAAHMAPLAHQTGDVFETLLAYLDRSHQDVRAVYELDRAHAFDRPDDTAARALVYARTAAASDMLRDLLVRAWQESARPTPPPGPSPIDPATPGYDPETGSAPVP